MKYIFILFFLSSLLASNDLSAHGGWHDRLDYLSQKIQQSPTAELYLERGAVYQLDGQMCEALHDFETAEKLDPAHKMLNYHFAMHHASQKQFVKARAKIDAFLGANPTSPLALAAHANVCEKAGDLQTAQSDRQKLSDSKLSVPSLFAELSDNALMLDSTEIKTAIQWMEKGLERFPNDVFLLSRAFDLYGHTQQYDEAVAIADKLLTLGVAKDLWLYRKAELQFESENCVAASTLNEAIDFIHQLPKTRRSSKARMKTEAQIDLLNEKVRLMCQKG